LVLSNRKPPQGAKYSGKLVIRSRPVPIFATYFEADAMIADAIEIDPLYVYTAVERGETQTEVCLRRDQVYAQPAWCALGF
jgi:hypothetical protein